MLLLGAGDISQLISASDSLQCVCMQGAPQMPLQDSQGLFIQFLIKTRSGLQLLFVTIPEAWGVPAPPLQAATRATPPPHTHTHVQCSQLLCRSLACPDFKPLLVKPFYGEDRIGIHHSSPSEAHTEVLKMLYGIFVTPALYHWHWWV